MILGELQNDIKDLPDIDMERYERIFKVHEQYKGDKLFKFYNITNKIELPEDIDSSILLEYNVLSRMPLTIISSDIYGSVDRWWSIYLINKDLIPDIFYVEPGVTLKYIDPAKIGIIYNQITQEIVHNGRHF